MKPIRSLCLASLALVLIWPARAHAQSSTADLVAEVRAVDAAAFQAFNDHDLEGLMAYFSEDLEFYHDTDGALGYEDVVEGFRSLFANDNGLRREPIAESMKVYPIPGFGAQQVGQHRFCHDENGVEECGVFGFTTVWRNTDGHWRMTRVMSYGH